MINSIYFSESSVIVGQGLQNNLVNSTITSSSKVEQKQPEPVKEIRVSPVNVDGLEPKATTVLGGITVLNEDEHVAEKIDEKDIALKKAGNNFIFIKYM
jgi:hypothetical protein